MSSKLFEHSSAVRGYHYFRKCWQPTPNQVLECFHERDNPYDFFAIKVCDVDSGMTVGHLQKGSKRGAKVIAVLTSTNYCVSPLVQGGLEIPCRVEISMPPTVKNKQIMNIYIKKWLICFIMNGKKQPAKVGSFQSSQEAEPLRIQPKAKKKKSNCKEDSNPSISEGVVEPVRLEKDIRSFFHMKKVVASSSSSTEEKKTPNVIIELSDSD